MKVSRFKRAGVACLILGLAATLAFTRGDDPVFTTDFNLDECHLVPAGHNPYFDLTPGRFVRLEGEDDGETVVVEITVLPDTKRILWENPDGRMLRARARVVEEREWADDELIEVSRNYFARCATTNDVYYLGEFVDNYKDGKIIDHEGSWEAGVNGALPGLIMPGSFLLGSRYFQEIAEEEEALDRAENVEMNLVVETKAGVFTGCILIVETSPLEPKEESIKVYAPGVGMIIDDDLELTDFGG